MKGSHGRVPFRVGNVLKRPCVTESGTMYDEDRIRVTGRARVSAPADVTVVRMTISGLRRTYDQAVSDMAGMTSVLKDAVEAAGLDRESLKTSSVSVEQHYRKVKIGEDKNGYDRFEDVFDGFEFSSGTVIEFPNDNGKLSELVARVMDTDASPRITFGFRNSDPEGMRRRALSKATRNAMEDARAIAEAVGSRLGRLVGAEYGAPTPRYADGDVGARYYEADMIAAAPSLDITPEDDETTASVDLVWEIAQRSS